ncbi:MAG: putative Ig domain-containing protein [Bacteroidetes bacterium]|nr:putative Ig domain-containing protein [Bacteroidota bacterium]
MKQSILFLLALLYLQLTAQKQLPLNEGSPQIHNATVVGNYPNTELILSIAATGEKPIRYDAQNLPKGLKLDEATGIISGTVTERGNYTVKLVAKNKHGWKEQDIRLAIGDTLCYTPPLGWNSWNVFTKDINEKMLMEIADAMASNGMRDVGYQYINIDDFWHAESRDSVTGKPVVDPAKFPHGMKYLSDYVHSKGLKLGIYSCAGTKTCGKCFGGYSFEEIDAKTYAEWGIDLLKYDFCFTPWSKKEAVERYTKMGTALKNSGRSIVFSVCNWGLFKPWKWAPQAGGQYWRTTPDIFDIWKGGKSNIFRNSMMYILKRQNRLAKYAGPGHYNDPDMLLVGNYGKGKATSWNGNFKGMTDTEYESHMSLWAMMAAPLLSSNDLRNMNDCTQTILTNYELLAINQDAKGEQAKLVKKKRGVWVYKKELSNGDIAVAVLNTKKKHDFFRLGFEMFEGDKTYTVRDVWKHTDMGINNGCVYSHLDAHETSVYIFSKPK